MPEILPSLLAADFTRLGEHIAQVEAAGARILHIDIMDGHFVPNLSMGTPVVAAVRKVTRLTLDVHLMVANTDAVAPLFLEAGADCVSVHQETTPHLDRTLRLIQSEGARAGVVLNPSTPLATIEHALEICDYVLLMSVNPGFGGQKLIPYVLDKARALRQERDRRGLDFAIEIDGGVSVDNIGKVAEAGVDWIVAGSSVFGEADPGAAYTRLALSAREAVARPA
jgi:ribulose-phosphate 3-epimerase